MKILSVRFQNLNSLKGEHEIRFDQSPLADAGLFAITGQTGAGKTTILDAITVGLYGLVHRHNNDSPLELMTRHTAESFSEVEFEANGVRYRSKWHIRRSRGKVEGNMRPVHMELCDLADEKPFDLKPSQVPNKVAELCGLDYSQFLRSVMLSQGDFARFLKANPNERSSLLEKITDTGIYSEISKAAYTKSRTERQLQEDLERRLQDNQLLPEEQRQAYAQSVAEVQERETALQQEIADLQAQVQWLQQLAQLQTKKEQHEQSLQVQEQKLTQLQPEFRKLQQHEQAYQYAGELAEIRSAEGKVQEVKAQLLTLESQLPTLQQELEQASAAAAAAANAHMQQEKSLQELEPLLAQVTQLDHQLQSIREHYTQEKTAYVQFGETLQQEQTQLQARQQHLATLTTQATAIKTWLEEKQRFQDLNEHLPELKGTVRALQEASQRMLRLKKDTQQLTTLQAEDAKQQTRLQKSLQAHDTQLKDLATQKQEQLTVLQNLLADRTLDDLEASAQAQPLLLARLEKLSEFAKQHAQHTLRHTTLIAQHTHLQTAITTKSSEIIGYKQQQQTASERLEDLQKLVLLQQQIQKYEEARHALQPDAPCPLCGSQHHPFVEGGYTLNLPEEVLKRDKQQALVNELLQTIQHLELQHNTLQQEQKANTALKAELTQELTRLQKTFAETSAETGLSIEDTAAVEQQLDAQRQAIGQLQHTLTQARQTGRALEQLNNQLQQRREEQLRAQAQRDKLEQAVSIRGEQLSKLKTDLQDEAEQAQTHTGFITSFALSYGYTFDPENPLKLVEELSHQASLYLQQHNALQLMREEYAQVNTEVKHLQARLDEKEAGLAKRQETLKQEHAKLTALKETREELFGTKQPQQERQTAQQTLRTRATAAEDARTHFLQKQQELRETRLRQTECTTTHQKTKSLLDSLCEGLKQAIQPKGIATIEALTQMLLDRDEAERLANLKAQTEKHLTELRKSLLDVQHELAAMQEQNLTSDSVEALQIALAEKSSQQRELIAQRARTQQLLDQDAAQREKHAALALQLHTQRQVCHRWAQLAELIGSADGNKFSRFAQGLTLARLVELANQHLLKLNDRYRILKSSKEDLELLIVDTYQAEAIRPMNTLSGGESFLVSLSLALGLSDLAGRRTQINSLFIDEGFGTLDADTLDAAITTLENLQASGKTIGIISHVEALKDRISTQIKVRKKAGGVSTLEVVGW
ncbi:AAA family ATPase [Pontibacter sp. CAU 1760]